MSVVYVAPVVRSSAKDSKVSTRLSSDSPESQPKESESDLLADLSAPRRRGRILAPVDFAQISVALPGRGKGPAPEDPPIHMTAQPKLLIGAVDDAYERQADQIADRVVNGEPAVPVRGTIGASNSSPVLRRKCNDGECGECQSCLEEARILQRKSDGSLGGTTAPASVHEVLRSPGAPLAPSLRAFFEPKFGGTLAASGFTRARRLRNRRGRSGRVHIRLARMWCLEKTTTRRIPRRVVVYWLTS